MIFLMSEGGQFGCNFAIEVDTFGHDQSIPGLFAPTRQYEWMDVKRFGDILYRHSRKLAQSN
jgi:hypothetical protein